MLVELVESKTKTVCRRPFFESTVCEVFFSLYPNLRINLGYLLSSGSLSSAAVKRTLLARPEPCYSRRICIDEVGGVEIQRILNRRLFYR